MIFFESTIRFVSYAFLGLIMLSGCNSTYGKFNPIKPGSSPNRLESRARVKTIRNDTGGVIVTYARDVQRVRKSKRKVKFSGSCDSACTLYLSLPGNQICIMPGASFRFHAPFGGTQASNEAARKYLMQKYPAWVRNWIKTNGGLSSKISVMPYSFARRHVRHCRGSQSI